LQQELTSINAFKTKQQSAFNAEREHWVATGQANYSQENEQDNVNNQALEIPAGHAVAKSHVAGNLWQIKVAEGDMVTAGDVLVVVESMKMEISVTAQCSGKISKLICAEATPVAAGQALLLIEELV
jgi:urea carboxylase